MDNNIHNSARSSQILDSSNLKPPENNLSNEINNVNTESPIPELKNTSKTNTQTTESPAETSNLKLFGKSFLSIIKGSFRAVGLMKKSETPKNTETTTKLNNASKGAVIAGKALGVLSTIAIGLAATVFSGGAIAIIGLSQAGKALKNLATSKEETIKSAPQKMDTSNKEISKNEPVKLSNTESEPYERKQIQDFDLALNFLKSAPQQMNNQAIESINQKIGKNESKINENTNKIKELQVKVKSEDNKEKREHIFKEIKELKEDNKDLELMNKVLFPRKMNQTVDNLEKLVNIVSSNLESHDLSYYKSFAEEKPKDFNDFINSLSSYRPKLAKQLSTGIKNFENLKPEHKNIYELAQKNPQEYCKSLQVQLENGDNKILSDYNNFAKEAPKAFAMHVVTLTKSNPELTGKLLNSLNSIKGEIFTDIANKLNDSQTLANVLKSMLQDKINDSDKLGTLLRKNDNSSLMVASFVKKYLNPIFKDNFEKQLSKLPTSTTKNKKGDFIEGNIKNHDKITENILNNLNNFIKTTDNKDFKIFQQLCKDLHQVGTHKYNEPGGKKVLANMLFLRAFAPIISMPNVALGISLNNEQKDHAIILGKIVQNLANEIEMGVKDKDLAQFKDWGNTTGAPLINEIYNNLINV